MEVILYLDDDLRLTSAVWAVNQRRVHGLSKEHFSVAVSFEFTI